MLRPRISAARIAHLNRCYHLRCPSRLNRSGLHLAPPCGRNLHFSSSQLQQWNPQQYYNDYHLTNPQPNSNQATENQEFQDEEQQQQQQQQQRWRRAPPAMKGQDKPIQVHGQANPGAPYQQQLYPQIEPTRYIPFANRIPSKANSPSSSMLYPQVKVSPETDVAVSAGVEASQEVESSVQDAPIAPSDLETAESASSADVKPAAAENSSENDTYLQNQIPPQQPAEPHYYQQQPHHHQQQQQQPPHPLQQAQQGWYHQAPPNFYPQQQYGYYPQPGGYYPQQPAGYYQQAPPAGYYQQPPPYGYYPSQPYNYYYQQQPPQGQNYQQQEWVDPNIAIGGNSASQHTTSSPSPGSTQSATSSPSSSGSVGGSTTVEKEQEQRNNLSQNKLDTAESQSGVAQGMHDQEPSFSDSTIDQSSKSIDHSLSGQETSKASYSTFNESSEPSLEASGAAELQEIYSKATIESSVAASDGENQSRTPPESAHNVSNTPTETPQATNQTDTSSWPPSDNSKGLNQQEATLKEPWTSSQPSLSASGSLGDKPWTAPSTPSWGTSSIGQTPMYDTKELNSNKNQIQDNKECHSSEAQYYTNTAQDASATQEPQESQPWTPHESPSWNAPAIGQPITTATPSHEQSLQKPTESEISSGKYDVHEAAEEPVSTGETPPEELTTAESAAPEAETPEDYTASILDAAYPEDKAKAAAEEDTAASMLDQMFPEEPVISQQTSSEDNASAILNQMFPEETATPESYQQEQYLSNKQDSLPQEQNINRTRGQDSPDVDDISSMLDHSFPFDAPAALKTQETQATQAPTWAKSGGQQDMHAQDYDSKIQNQPQGMPLDAQQSHPQHPYPSDSSVPQGSWNESATSGWQTEARQPSQTSSPWRSSTSSAIPPSSAPSITWQSQRQPSQQTSQQNTPQDTPGEADTPSWASKNTTTYESYPGDQHHGNTLADVQGSPDTNLGSTPQQYHIPSSRDAGFQQQLVHQAKSISESASTTTEPSGVQTPSQKPSQPHVVSFAPHPPPPFAPTTPTAPHATFTGTVTSQQPLQPPPPFAAGQTVQSSLPHSVKKDVTMTTSYSNPKYAKAARMLLELANKQLKDTAPVFKQAKSMAREGFAPTVEMYAVLIGSLAKQEDRVVYQHIALGLLDEMQAEGLQPNSAIYHSLLKILAVSPDFLTRERILEEMRLKWIPLTQEGVESVIFGLLTDGQLERALEIFDSRNANHDPISLTVYLETIKALGRAYEIDEALRIGREAIEDLPSRKTTMVWYELLTVAANCLHLEGTTWVWESAVRKGVFNPDDGVCLKVLNTAARHGAPQLAAEVLRILADRGITLDESHYNSLITAFARGNNVPMAFRTISKIREAGLSPSPTTSSSIADALVTNGKVEDVDTAYFALKDMHNEGADGGVDIIAFNSIIEACVRLGDLERALGVYNDAVSLNVYPNTNTFNSLLFGCVGLWADRLSPLEETIDSESQPPPPQKELALYLAGEMKAAGTNPDMRTYELLLQTCLYQEEYDDAFTYLEEMKSMHETIGPVRPSVYRWLGWKLLHTNDERVELLLDEMVEVGYGQDANNIGGLLHGKRMRAAQQGQENEPQTSPNQPHHQQ